MSFLSQLAAEHTETESNLFSALGIDWRLLILQIIAFLILVFILGKFVFPWLMKNVDDRQANIEKATKAAEEAEKAAARSEEKVAALLAEARKEAADIVGTAKLESAELVSASEQKARQSAEKIVADAHERIEKDIEQVKKELHNETLELVSFATEKVVGKTLSQKADNELIAAALKESK